jgi:hypothetical protein
MGIGLRVTGRTTAIGSCKYAVLRRSVSVILTGSHGFRSRRTVTLEKSSRSQTSSSMMVESLDIVGCCESGMVQPNSIFRFPKRNQGCNGSLPASSPVDHGKVETYFPLGLYQNGVPCLLRRLTNLRHQLWFYYAAYDMRYVRSTNTYERTSHS